MIFKAWATLVWSKASGIFEWRKKLNTIGVIDALFNVCKGIPKRQIPKCQTWVTHYKMSCLMLL